MNNHILKKASPKWVSLFENLSPEDQRRILAMRPRERTLRPLGKGSSNVSDLVVHPQHGLSVRKIMKIIGDYKKLIENSVDHRTGQLRAETRLKELAGGGGPFAHLLGVERIKNTNLARLGFDEGVPNAKAYYEFAKGDVHPDLKWADMRAKELSNRYGEQWYYNPRFKDDYNKIVSIYRDERNLGPLGESIKKKMQEEGYPMWDLRHPNIIGGKVVDFEGTRDGLAKKERGEIAYRNLRDTYGDNDFTPNQVRKFWLSENQNPTYPEVQTQKRLLARLREKHGPQRMQNIRAEYGIPSGPYTPFKYNTDPGFNLPETTKPSIGKFFNRAISNLKAKLGRQ